MKQCDNEAFCLCCKHKHQTSDKQKCKEWEMQNKIKIITATKPLSYKEVRNEIDFFTENKFDVFNRTEDSVKVFETFAERYDLPLVTNKKKKENKRKESYKSDPHHEISVKRKRDESEELLGVALNNNYKVDDIEKFNNEIEIIKIKENYNNFMINIMSRLNKKENMEKILFDIERNIQYEYVSINEKT